MKAFSKQIEKIITKTILLRIVAGYSSDDIDEQVDILRELANEIREVNEEEIKKATK